MHDIFFIITPKSLWQCWFIKKITPKIFQSSNFYFELYFFPIFTCDFGTSSQALFLGCPSITGGKGRVPPYGSFNLQPPHPRFLDLLRNLDFINKFSNNYEIKYIAIIMAIRNSIFKILNTLSIIFANKFFTMTCCKRHPTL